MPLEAGMIPQATSLHHVSLRYIPLSIMPRLPISLIEAGAPEICLKDMAGIGSPRYVGQLVRSYQGKTSGCH